MWEDLFPFYIRRLAAPLFFMYAKLNYNDQLLAKAKLFFLW